MFEVGTTPDKGRGIFALVDIPKGKRIIQEAPLLVVKEDRYPIPERMDKRISEALKTLSAEDRAIFHSLHNAFPDRPCKLWETFQCNCFPLGPDIAVYATLCRINHSCNPSAYHSWNANLGMQTVHAIRDIRKGEEITITYGVGDILTRAERREYLRQGYAFECACELCGASDVEVAASDGRRREIKALFAANDDDVRPEMTPDAVLQDCLRLQHLRELEYGSADNPFAASAWYDAFQVVACHGRMEDAIAFATRAYHARVQLEGEDSPDAQLLHRYMEDPRVFHCFGLYSGWRSNGGSGR
jgi:hypothetical protein